ncbi:MAG: pyridoxal-phosphate-dependent aminotransferase family protein [Fusobacteriota bacterium]
MRNLLMSPGPTQIPERVKLEMAKDIIHHRTGEYSKIFKELSKNLKKIFKTENPVITLTSSGTGAMEASVTNLFSKGDKVVVFNNGKFGGRFAKLAKLYDLEVIEIAYEWGEVASLEDLKKILKKHNDIKGVFLTHHETSTGIINDVEAFGEVLKDTDIVFVVDSISGMIANDFKTDEWNVDCAISGAQKGFMTPPGIAFVSLSDKAQKAMERSDLPAFYFSFEKHLGRYPQGQNPTTPAVTVILAANEACKMLLEEGMDNVIKRHKNMRDASCIGIKKLGLDFFVKDLDTMGNTLTTVKVPEGIDGAKIPQLMKDKHGITIAGGQADYKGKIFRIGHLGEVDTSDVLVTFSALEQVLVELGYDKFEPGDSVKAIQEFLMK